MRKLLGYADQITVASGGMIAFKVSSEDSKPYSAGIVRIIHGDTNPAGPGYQDAEIEDARWHLQGRAQGTRAGSCIIVPPANAFRALSSFKLNLWIWPTTPHKPEQVLAALWEPARQAGFMLRLHGAAGLVLQLGNGAGSTADISLGVPLLERHWYHVHAAFDAAHRRAELRHTALTHYAGYADNAECSYDVAIDMLGGPDAAFIMAACQSPGGDGYQSFYNGKIEAPCLFGAAASPVAAWDFWPGIGGITVHDITGNGLHGSTWQGPARAMTGHLWDGTETNWRRAPAQYGAIHFHDDDLHDAGWETDFIWRVPDGLRSGLYAAHLRGDDDEDYIPFVVRRSPSTADARLLFIVPTASYLAYANEHLALDAAIAELVHDHVPVFGPNDLYLAAHRELGGSLYDRHSDSSGIFTSSRLRPILNMRPKYQSWLGGTGSALWQLNADTHLLAWLERLGVPFDCITDEDLDRDGAAALRPYQCVMTGTHAEYWSTNMRDALDIFRDEGGRIMHMGGNGLYWRIAFDPAGSGAIEVRRCEVGNGWITAPGESYHAFSGEYGGLWRRLGRPPQQSVGVGFVGQGFDLCSYYRRLPDSHDPRAAFIFAGVDDDIIGDFGLIGGGAAGIELDRTDQALGTPPNTLVLARSEGHTTNYLPTVEELLINYVNQAEISPVHGEMVYFETPSGGAVFATGSIAWAGSLSHNGYSNNVARITENVVRRFLDPTPFRLSTTYLVRETL